jgi:N-acetylmuramoyl-L-alanine amidase
MIKVCLKYPFFNLSLTAKGVFIALLLILYNPQELQSQKPFKIVIDAGHGGKDPGRPNKSGIKEKDIVLNIALDLGKKLKNSGNEVIYTRDKDVFLTLRQRAKIANDVDADLFISIHCNAFHDHRVYGSETFVYGLHVNKANFNVALKENEVIFLEEDFEKNYKGFDPNSPESLIGITLMQEEYLDQSILLASLVQDNFTKDLKRKNRGVKQSGFWVLHNTYMPSILIEAGFMTNAREGAYLNSKKGQTDISNSIFKAIESYKKAINYSADNQPKTVNNIIYKVQISASKRRLELKSYNFKGLKNLSRIKQGSTYKYFYSSSSDLEEIKEKKKYARSKGFSNAYIVGFENGKLFDVD